MVKWGLSDLRSLNGVVVFGAPGSGKSNFIRHLLQSATDVGDRQILYAFKPEMYGLLPPIPITEGNETGDPLLINPADLRSWVWDVAKEVTSVEGCIELARYLVQGAEFTNLAREDASMKLLSTIPGIGPLNATAFVASVGKAETFGRGRDLAAWLGLVPRQMTTGGKPKLLGISKRGNGYLRKMLIHGARAALPSLAKGKTLLGEWLRGLLSRTHMNTAVVALAAKMARIIWAVLRSGRPFELAATPSAG